MINKILIANRGEIACRIIRTCKRLGLKTVAVYSAADENSLHMMMADEAVFIGDSMPAKSYLDINKVISAAKQTGADAIHPGYGFLSENASFVTRCHQENIIFIGPSADVIKAMGIKDQAKAIVRQANVAVIEGFQSENNELQASPQLLQKEADKIGYPLLIKAVAGGGGKGMRQVKNSDSFVSALKQAQSEAMASFSDDRVMLEKYIANARHIEVQILGDSFGNYIYLFERDCSAQRRYQKVIEEAPAPGVDENLRKAMGEAAVAVAKKISYVGAGTIEFIVDADKPLTEESFFFMEMNTRLQVEHPISEAITGIDIVALQIDIANNKPLAIDQSSLKIDGWAMEARIYAEDVESGFLPSTGHIDMLHFAQNNVRIDSGFREGDEVSPYYDPMMAKVIVHAENREQAISLLKQKLEQTRIVGCSTNIEFLIRLLTLEDFKNAKLTTKIIDTNLDKLIPKKEISHLDYAIAAVLFLGYFDHLYKRKNESEIEPSLFAFRSWCRQLEEDVKHQTDTTTQSKDLTSTDDYLDNLLSAQHKLKIAVIDQSPVEVIVAKGAQFSKYYAWIDGVFLDFKCLQDKDSIIIKHNGLKKTIHTYLSDQNLTIFDQGEQLNFLRVNEQEDESLSTQSSAEIKSPMPGTVIDIAIEIDDKVKKGQPILTLEAMKLHMVLEAEHDGIVRHIYTQRGEQVAKNKVLAVIEKIDRKN